MVHVARVVVEEIGIGLIFGLVLSWLATMMLRFAERHGWISEHWVEVPIVALAAACFATAQAAGGSAFIACFVGGLLPSGLGARHKEELLRGAEHTGEALALLTWFGPRGLATIAFAVLVLDEKLPGNDAMMLAAGWTVLLSVIAHGVTRNPLVKRMAGRSAELAAQTDDHAIGAEAQGQAFAPRLQTQIHPVCILQPHVALACLAHSPSDLGLTVNPLKILKTAKVVHASSSVEGRHADPADPQTAQFEWVAAAAVVQRAPADGTASDKCDLHLVDIDAARRLRRRRGLGVCAGCENAAQDQQSHRQPSGESCPLLVTEST
jgi:hypothetical protein